MPTDLPCPICAAPIVVGENNLKQPIRCWACSAELRMLLVALPAAVPATEAGPAEDALVLEFASEPVAPEPLPLPSENLVACPNCGQEIETDRRPGESMECLRCQHSWVISDQTDEEEENEAPVRRRAEAPRRSLVAPLVFTAIFLAAIAGFVLGAFRFLARPEDQYQVAGYVCISGAVWTTILTAIYFYRGCR